MDKAVNVVFSNGFRNTLGTFDIYIFIVKIPMALSLCRALDRRRKYFVG